MQPRLSENPWFWLMLFGSLGAVGVVVIGPKHAARQARLERMAETGERVRAAKDLGVNAAEVRKIKPGKAESSGGSPSPAGTSPSGTSPGATGSSGIVGPSGVFGLPGAGGPAGAPAAGSAKGPIEPYVESDFRRGPQLVWLLGLMIVLMLGGTAGMILSRRRQAA
jgi:hypothetical protein